MVTLHDQLPPDCPMQFVVITARYQGMWLYCRHRKRITFEMPGGHIEAGESPVDAAKRELYEETGAVHFTLQPMGYYGVRMPGAAGCTYGAIFYADIAMLGPLPAISEMAELRSLHGLPEYCTYPDIQPVIYNHVRQNLCL